MSNTNTDSPFPHSALSGQQPIEWPPVADGHSVPPHPQGQETLSEKGNLHPHYPVPQPFSWAHLAVCGSDTQSCSMLSIWEAIPY